MRVFQVALLTVAVAGIGDRAPLVAQRFQKNLLTAEEIERQGTILTAYEAVRRLRPMWLNPSDITMSSGNAGHVVSVAQVRIYVNDFNAGDLEYLKSISADEILEMRFLSQNETASRFGPTDGQVAIVVRLKKHE